MLLSADLFKNLNISCNYFHRIPLSVIQDETYCGSERTYNSTKFSSSEIPDPNHVSEIPQ